MNKSLISVMFGTIFITTPLFCVPANASEGHDAGYRWAEEHDILDVDYDNGNSESFNEGVREYAEEQAEAAREDGRVRMNRNNLKDIIARKGLR